MRKERKIKTKRYCQKIEACFINMLVCYQLSKTYKFTCIVKESMHISLHKEKHHKEYIQKIYKIRRRKQVTSASRKETKQARSVFNFFKFLHICLRVIRKIISTCPRLLQSLEVSLPLTKSRRALSSSASTVQSTTNW